MTDYSHHWSLTNEVVFLNHGSFGACPSVVLDHQMDLRRRIERQPVQFFHRDIYELIQSARSDLAAFIGAPSDDLVFVRNATEGINSVLRSYPLDAGDEILVTAHGYPACRNIVDYVASRSGAHVTVADFPFDGATTDQVISGIMNAVTQKTRLALLDHVPSPTGRVLPIEALIPILENRGIATLIDGAHGPGMLPLEMNALNPSWYVANLHKWVCAPKGAGFLYVRPDRRACLQPAILSHGYSLAESMPEMNAMHLSFDWPGTQDPTPWLCVPKAIDFMAGLVPGGWPEIRRRNRELCLTARRQLCDALGVTVPTEDGLIGHLAAMPLPNAEVDDEPSPLYGTSLQMSLLNNYGIEVPVIPWPSHPRRLIRISAALYNTPDDYIKLTSALREMDLCC